MPVLCFVLLWRGQAGVGGSTGVAQGGADAETEQVGEVFGIAAGGES